MLTRKNKQTSAPTVPTLPDWQADKTVVTLRAKIQDDEATIAQLSGQLPEMRAQLAALQRGQAEGQIMRSLGVSAEDSAAEAGYQRTIEDITRLAALINQTEAALTQTQAGLEAARAVLPKIETQARGRVMDELRATYMRQVDRFTTSVEAASAEQEVLYALYASISAQFPAGVDLPDGSYTPSALGVPAPIFQELRPPEARWEAPMASTLHRWRMSLASVRGVPTNGEE